MTRSHGCSDFAHTRRQMLSAGVGLFGLSMSELLGLRSLSAAPTGNGAGRAKTCIAFFSWGGMSHLETWDPKPDAPVEVRGAYRPIASAVPGVQVGEYMPRLAQQAGRLAIVRSVHHPEAGHRNAAYWNLTGHAPHTPGNDTTLPPSRRDWPCLGAQVARFRRSARGLPGTVALPYPLADRGLLNGQDAGFLGLNHDPLIVAPGAGKPYAGVSPNTGTASLRLPEGVNGQRFQDRRGLQDQLSGSAIGARSFDRYTQMAADLLLSPHVAAAFDLQREPTKLRAAYGDHVCGQSALLARRLTDAGVPLVTIYACAGDLNSGQGEHWDTHGDNFPRLKNQLLPPLEQASVALLDDLAERGRLDETLVVWLTEFGRSPRFTGTGRDHFPNCYSVAFAGGGIRGGQVYGRSDRTAATPADQPCGPEDLQATILHALGISADAHVEDNFGRPMALTDGRPLPLF